MDTAINPLVRESMIAAGASADSPSFRIVPSLCETPLLFAAPHAGRYYPSDLDANVDLFSLRRFEDTDVDQLLEDAPQHGATVVAGCFGRAYLDLNRSPDDLDPAMFGEPVMRSRPTNARIAAGLGLFARYASGGREIYGRKLSLDEANRRIATVHSPYHTQLTHILDKASARFGGAILIDWHSMPSAAAVSGLGQDRRSVDVVLGDRYGRACRPELILFVESALRALGLSVARNVPYAGGYTTERHGKPANNRQALQIELNRALYLDEASLTPTRDFPALRDLITQFTFQLAERAGDLIP
jgi:N-formylglutamate amidohydrolase